MGAVATGPLHTALARSSADFRRAAHAACGRAGADSDVVPVLLPAGAVSGAWLRVCAGCCGGIVGPNRAARALAYAGDPGVSAGGAVVLGAGSPPVARDVGAHSRPRHRQRDQRLLPG